MANYNTDLKTWGAAGSEPPDGYNYVKNEPPVDDFDNWLTDNLITDIEHLISTTNDRVESDKGTTRPSSPESAHIFADTGDGTFEWWDSSTSTWRRALDATGDTLEGPLTLNGNNINTGGTTATIRDTTNALDVLRANEGGRVDVPNGNLRLATAQSIEDGSGTQRLTVRQSDTILRNESGKNAIKLDSGAAHRLNAFSSTPVQVRDVEGGFTAVQYNTDTSTGTLELVNTDLKVPIGDTGSINANVDSASGNFVDRVWQLNLNDASGDDNVFEYNAGFPRFQFRNRTDGRVMLSIEPSGLVGIPNGNLRLGGGQSIEDGGGTERFFVGTGATIVRYEDGTRAVQAATGNHLRLSALANTPLRVEDGEGGFTAVQYTTGTSTGSLELTNANLETNGNYINSVGGGRITFGKDNKLLTNGGNTWTIRDDSNNIDIANFRGSGRVDIPNGNLRLATGQAIEDGAGQTRLDFRSTATDIVDSAGNVHISARDSSDSVARLQLAAFNGIPFVFRDQEGGFDVMEYTTTTSAPGTLELTNAELHPSEYIRFQSRSGISWPDQGGGYNALIRETTGGEIQAQDDAGNTVILT